MTRHNDVPSEFDSVNKYLDDVDCVKVGFVAGSLVPLSVYCDGP